MGQSISKKKLERLATEVELSLLLEHIECKHHALTRRELMRVERSLADVSEVVSQQSVVLNEVTQIVEELSQEVMIHLEKEENMLFPYLRRLFSIQGIDTKIERPFFQSAVNPIRVLRQEHEAIELYLQHLSEITNGFVVSSDSEAVLSLLYEALASLDIDLRQHIFLQDNALFPHVLFLEEVMFARKF